MQEIVQRIEILEKLVESQRKTLEIDNKIIDMKNRLLEMTEQENAMQSREILFLRVMCITFFFMILCLLVSEIMGLK